MRRGRLFIYLALLLILILGAAVILAPRLLNSGNSGNGAGEDTQPTPTPMLTVDVVIVVQPIPIGAEVKDEYLGTVPISQESLVGGLYMTDISKAVGRVAKYDLQQGLFLNENYLADSAEQVAKNISDISFLIEEGKLAISIPITRLSSVSYAPQRGDYVDVIVTLLLVDLDQDFQTLLPNFSGAVMAPNSNALLLGYTQEDAISANLTTGEDLGSLVAQIIGGGSVARVGKVYTDANLEQTFYVIPSEEQRPRLVSQTLLQNAMVLQVGTYTKPNQEELMKASSEMTGDTEATPTPAPGQPQQAQEPTPEPEKPDMITIAVSPQDAVTLNYLLYSGAQLTLALRGVGDTSEAETQTVTLRFLMDTYKITRPVREDFGIEPRVDTLALPELPNDVEATPAP